MLGLRAYYEGNVEVIATGHVPERVMRVLTDGHSPLGSTADAAAAADGLRHIVTEWREKNPRLFMHSPRVARHPDNWNRA